MGHGTGGHVEDDRVMFGARCGKGDGVGAEQRLAGAVRHHAGHAVDHAQGYQAFVGEWLHIRPQRGEVVRVVDRQHGDTSVACLRHQKFTGRRQRRLGEAACGIDANITGRHVADLRRGLAIDPAAGQCRNIARHAEHPMAMGTIALGAGAVVGQHPGHAFAAAMALEDALQQALQLGKRHTHDGAGGRCGHLKLLVGIGMATALQRQKLSCM
ncbi:hypothetical protein D3C81_1624650 [compost metagenome]